MQLTTLISTTLITCTGLAAAAPNAMPVKELSWPTTEAPVLEDYRDISSGVTQDNGDDDDADDESYLEKRGSPSWVRRVKFCENANGGGACNVKDFRPETGCYNMWSWFNDRMSSIYLAPNTYCMLFSDSNCRGKWLKAFDPGYSNLKVQSLLNDKVSSMRCYAR
ncbi:Beta/gamma crystallin [Macrophomina phaseolina MS6]|uniref:Beta/gamma crystallin n=2 Tax=Macrophomina phaseolina TaxID=35725 RepID=K2RQI6_MACPH|nr:Beta/gamma crystallin [Macrophomina phaseolina MS6]KAH7044464.1 hypothetical protein B0J12DRAFT_701458 [Macrophomina phaseolina]